MTRSQTAYVQCNAELLTKGDLMGLGICNTATWVKCQTQTAEHKWHGFGA